MLNKFIKLILIYIVFIILGTSIYIFSFSIDFPEKYDFLFIRSGVMLIIASSLIALLLIMLKYKKTCIFSLLLLQDIALIFFMTLILNWFIYGLIPFNVSRSNSIIILKFMYDNQNNLISKNEIKLFTQKKYFEEYDAIGVRIEEQLKSGNIEEINGKYFITPKGIFVANLMLFISNFYNLKNNFLKN
ncbi:hypothetical protein G6708_07990 [Polynucleobacter paneuropaeus]|nr:hypothetical protein [Polynucleobacter paneuropaeus]